MDSFTTHLLSSLKAYTALIGAVLTAILGTVPPHTELWTVLTAISAVITAIATWTVPNLDPDDQLGTPIDYDNEDAEDATPSAGLS